MSEVAVVFIVEAGDLEHKSKLLVESIRRLEPELTIYAVKPRKGRKIKPDTLLMFDQQGVIFIDRPLNQETSFFAFANKIYAAEFIERQHGTQHKTLIYLDADVLVLQPLTQITQALKPFEVALKPSDNDSGMASPSGSPPNRLWQWIYNTLNVDLDKVWTLNDYTSGQAIRAYYNGGIIFKSGTNQLYQSWLENFQSLSRDRQFFRLTGLQLFFLEQMCLTATILKNFGEEQVRPLDNTYNYPYNLHRETREPISELERIKIVHYHHEFVSNKWKTDFKVNPDLSAWLEARLPLPVPRKKSTVTRFFEIMAYQQHKLRYNLLSNG